MVNKLLDFAPLRIFVELSSSLQRGLFQLEMVTKIAVTEVRFHPVEEEAVAEIEVGTVRTLEDYRDASTFDEITHRSCTVWSCIVPLSKNV